MHKHKLFAAIIAFPAAILLWLYVVTVVSPNSTRVIRDIPINYEGSILLEEQDLILISDGGKVSLKVYGDRVNLNKLTNQNINVVADLSKEAITKAGEYSISLSVTFPDSAGKFSFDFLDKSKSDIQISVAELVTKTIPVELETGEEKAKEGYFFDSTNATANPSEITITGPDFEVSQIRKAVIDCTDISKLEETVVEQRQIVLQDAEGKEAKLILSTVGQTQATVMLPIQKYKELQLSVDIRDGGGAKQENIESITYSTSSIIVRGSASQIDNLDDVLVIGTLDLAKVYASDNKKTFAVVLPTGIKNVNGINKVDVSVKLKGLRLQTYLVFADEIDLLNVPQNAKITVNVEKIAVKLRGPEADIASVNANDIKISLDLSNVSESGEVLATVIVNGYPNVAVIEDVYVDITVQ